MDNMDAIYARQYAMEKQVTAQLAEYLSLSNGRPFSADSILLTTHETDAGYDISLPAMSHVNPIGARNDLLILREGLGELVESVEILGQQALEVADQHAHLSFTPKPMLFLRCNLPAAQGDNARRNREETYRNALERIQAEQRRRPTRAGEEGRLLNPSGRRDMHVLQNQLSRKTEGTQKISDVEAAVRRERKGLYETEGCQVQSRVLFLEAMQTKLGYALNGPGAAPSQR